MSTLTLTPKTLTIQNKYVPILTTAKQAMFMLYIGLIGAAALRGIWIGLRKWWSWKTIRTKKTLSKGLVFLEDTVNMIRDAVYFCGYLGGATIINIIVAGTFPVSVPTLLLLFNDKNNNDERVDKL